jgi:hypothetical protein
MKIGCANPSPGRGWRTVVIDEIDLPDPGPEQVTVRNFASGETIHTMPFLVDAEIVCDAMIAADAYGRALR